MKQHSADNREWLDSQRQWRRHCANAFRIRDTAEERMLQLLREPDSQWTAQYKTKERAIASAAVAVDVARRVAHAGSAPRMQRELTKLAEQLEALTEE